MRIVAILHRSAGNESVGDMWKETKVFDSMVSISEVLDWVKTRDTTLERMHLELSIVQD